MKDSQQLANKVEFRSFDEISKDQAVISSFLKLSESEKNLLYCALVVCKKNKVRVTCDRIRVRASDLANAFELSEGEAYKELYDAAEKLFEREFTYIGFSEEGSKFYGISRWIGSFCFTPIEQCLELCFAPCVFDFLNAAIHKLDDESTGINLSQKQISVT